MTHDGGSSWAAVSILKSDKDLRSAKLISGLAVLDGDRAAILVKDNPYSGQVIVYTVDGGKTWSKTDIPHSGIRRLVAHGGEYWVFGHEVIDRERGDGGYGVALAAHSQDGLHWVHGVTSPNEYSACNSQGCIIHDGAIVELYQKKPQSLGSSQRTAHSHRIGRWQEKWSAPWGALLSARMRALQKQFLPHRK